MTHFKRIVGVTAAGAAAVLALSACSGSVGTDDAASDGSGSTLNLAFFGDISTPDPDTAYDGSELNLVNSAYEGLVTYEPGVAEPTLAPALATEWSVNEDNTVYTFTLRPDVTFHDGTELTSAAVEPSFARRTAVDAGPAYMVADVASVETPSDTEVVITLKAPSSAFLDYLASPFGPKIISPKALEENSTDNGSDFFATSDAGTGPYEYGTFDKGTSYELTAYPDYWGDAPGYDTIDFTVVSNAATLQLQLESGDIDGIAGYNDKTSFEAYQAGDKLATYAFPSMQTPTLFVNPASAALGDTTARLAFLSSIDFASLADAALGATAEPTTELFPANMVDPSLDQQAITYDPAALDGLATTLAGKSISIGYASISPDAQALSDNLAAVLNGAGVSATSVGYAQGTYYSSLSDPAAAPDLTFYAGFPDTGAPDAWARVFYSPSGGLDLFGATVDGLDALLDQALQTGDESLYGEIATKVSESGYWYTVASSKGTAVFQKSVGGVDESFNPVITGALTLSKLYPAS